MSSLAVSGSVMPAILPYESDLVPGYKQFYNKWTRWAKENFEYVNYTEPFGEQVQPGSVDGYARIKGDHGFVFLFNGNPRPSQIVFEVGDDINLQEEGDYEFVELYPTDDGGIVIDNHGHSIFALGQKASLTIPANSCRLFELKRVAETTKPDTTNLVLIGVSGQVGSAKEQLDITAVRGKPGHVYPIRVRLSDPGSVKTVKVNGIEQHFSRTEKELQLSIQFAGDVYMRELDHWTKPDGGAFEFPYHDKHDSLKIRTTLRINKDVVELLEKAKPKNFDEMGQKIAAWQVSEEGSYSYHNCTCCRPDRLWLIIPFTHGAARDVAITIHSQAEDNRKKDADVPKLRYDRYGHSYYMDVTNLVDYGADNEIELSIRNLQKNEFMGPFLMYPGEELTSHVLPKPNHAGKRVVYTKSLVPAGPPRYVKGAKRPVITEAKVMGNVTLTKGTQLRVRVDLPPEKL